MSPFLICALRSLRQRRHLGQRGFADKGHTQIIIATGGLRRAAWIAAHGVLSDPIAQGWKQLNSRRDV
jgi:hypothetical protein